jgi:hypothetical protein
MLWMDSPVIDLEITPQRLVELIRWHGTDESNLPPEHTLQNLSRDTVAALRKLQHYQDSLEQLRAAMGEAFWAADLREVRAILLDALGPPPAELPAEDGSEWLVGSGPNRAPAVRIQLPASPRTS